MKVILKQSVPKVGKEGQVVSVKDGYARNFLFPRGMAVVADRGQMRGLEARNARLQAKLDETKSGAEGVKAKLDGQVLKIEGKVGKDTGRLFGAVTSQDIADSIKKAFGVELDKKAVLLSHPLKTLGNHSVEIDVHRLVDIKLTVNVFDPEAPVEAAAQEEAAAQDVAAPASEPEPEPADESGTEEA